MKVLKSVIDIIKYVYCWYSDLVEMCLPFYAEIWWTIEPDFNSTVDVSKTSTCEPKKVGTVDKCSSWISLRSRSKLIACGNICCGFRQNLCKEAKVQSSWAFSTEWGKVYRAGGIGSKLYHQTRVCLGSMSLCCLPGRYTFSLFWKDDIFFHYAAKMVRDDKKQYSGILTGEISFYNSMARKMKYFWK